MNESGFDFRDIVSGFKRRAWVLAASIIVITPIVLLIALLLPPYYSSTAKILVQSQQIPNELVQSTVNVRAAERLALIQQRLTTRQNLLELADRLRIFEDKPQMSSTDIVEALRESILVEEIALSDRPSRVTQAAAFTVTYNSRSPVNAARVANELVTMVLQENLETRAKRAADTRTFLDKKSRDLAVELSRIEGEIARFKIENAEALPTSLHNRQSELSDLRERRYGLLQQRVTLEERRRALREGIDAGVLLSDGTESPRTPEERKLDTLKQQLAEARGVFASGHPSIRALRSRIASLEASIVSSRESSLATSDAPRGESAGGEIQTDRERQLTLIDRQYKLFVERIDAANKRIKSLEESIAATPDTEIALSALERRRSDLAAQHQSASVKSAKAADGEELELNRQAERYEILEQAQIPQTPDSPPRKLIAAGGFGGSIMLGFGLIVLLELMNRTIRTSRHLTTQIGLTPIVTIPMIRTSQEVTKRRLTTGVYVLLLIGLGFGIVFMIDQYVTPIDRLVTNFLDDAQLTPIVEEARERFAGSIDALKGWLRRLTGGVI